VRDIVADRSERSVIERFPEKILLSGQKIDKRTELAYSDPPDQLFGCLDVDRDGVLQYRTTIARSSRPICDHFRTLCPSPIEHLKNEPSRPRSGVRPFDS
jgi:hypothetical protein